MGKHYPGIDLSILSLEASSTSNGPYASDAKEDGHVASPTS